MANRPGADNLVRIIGGSLRGRRIPFPDAEGLRPTGDRVRETLFNWLQSLIPGSHCLDLFAGSGALGFEAASRGAERVVMLERNPRVAAQLRENARTLGLSTVEIVSADALAWLKSGEGEFDVVFADPPFADHLLAPVLSDLTRPGLLRDGARIYVESDAREPLPQQSPGLNFLREKRAGQVRYGLLEYHPPLPQ